MDKKRLVVFAVCLTVCLAISGTAMARTIQEGGIYYPPGHYLAGQEIKVGFDIFGINYQAHMLNGWKINYWLGMLGYPPYQGDDEAYLAENPDAEELMVWQIRRHQGRYEWNDAFTSNQDRDGDGLLDLHYGYPTFQGSGAWIKSVVESSWTQLVDGEEVEVLSSNVVWTAAVPAGAYQDWGKVGLWDDCWCPWTWYTPDGVQIGGMSWTWYLTFGDMTMAGVRDIVYCTEPAWPGAMPEGECIWYRSPAVNSLPGG